MRHSARFSARGGAAGPATRCTARRSGLGTGPNNGHRRPVSARSSGSHRGWHHVVAHLPSFVRAPRTARRGQASAGTRCFVGFATVDSVVDEPRLAPRAHAMAAATRAQAHPCTRRFFNRSVINRHLGGNESTNPMELRADSGGPHGLAHPSRHGDRCIGSCRLSRRAMARARSGLGVLGPPPLLVGRPSHGGCIGLHGRRVGLCLRRGEAATRRGSGMPHSRDGSRASAVRRPVPRSRRVADAARGCSASSTGVGDGAAACRDRRSHAGRPAGSLSLRSLGCRGRVPGARRRGTGRSRPSAPLVARAATPSFTGQAPRKPPPAASTGAEP